jgi:gamma-glutamyltranspeptidase/glutathione hydrolase
MSRPDAGGRSTVFGTAGVVACEHPAAAVAGIRALDAGGTAADACVAMAAVLAVVAPMMTGIGGDAFLLHYDAASGRVRGLEGAGRAGRDASIEAMRARGHADMPERGGEPITVPGAVRLWDDAAAALGRMPLATLLEPAVRLAEEGFPVAEVSARMWQEAEPLLARNEAAAAALLPGGRAPRAGELVRLPDLARTLAGIAERGAAAFYEGEVAERIVAAARTAGGFLREEDLAEHRSSWAEPIATDYRGLRVHELPPPTTGVAALWMLDELAEADLGALHPLGAERVDLEVRAKLRAFARLFAEVGDPGPGRGEGDTVYLCAVDREGNGCSFINSLYKSFGSGVVAPGTGVVLNDRGFAFTLEPGHPNALAPGKRPLHTIIPALVTEDERLWAVLGNMGGFMQPQGHVRVLGNLRDFGMAPQEAVDHPRHFHDAGVLLLEGRFPEREIARLRELGHDVVVGPPYAIPTGGAQVIRLLDGGVRAAGSDPRKDGCALAQ